MSVLYIASVWLHIVSAVVWIGGMTFLVLVLVPALRGLTERGLAARLMHLVGVRFRTVGWVSLFLLLVTGAVNLAARGISWASIASGELWQSQFGRTLGIKLCLVALILAASAVHDFLIGPRATRRGQASPDDREAVRLRRQAAWIGRLNLLASLIVVALGILLVRGWPRF